jgi:hypothetical protein
VELVNSSTLAFSVVHCRYFVNRARLPYFNRSRSLGLTRLWASIARSAVAAFVADLTVSCSLHHGLTTGVADNRRDLPKEGVADKPLDSKNLRDTPGYGAGGLDRGRLVVSTTAAAAYRRDSRLGRQVMQQVCRRFEYRIGVFRRVSYL